jgi:putative transposase
MILTYKVKHGKDFSHELGLAKKVALFGLEHKSTSSADVKHFGLKSAISNQILKKYSKNKKLKNVRSVKLTIPNQGIRVVDDKVYVPCLKLSLDIYFDKAFTKINQVEIGEQFA